MLTALPNRWCTSYTGWSSFAAAEAIGYAAIGIENHRAYYEMSVRAIPIF